MILNTKTKSTENLLHIHQTHMVNSITSLKRVFLLLLPYPDQLQVALKFDAQWEYPH